MKESFGIPAASGKRLSKQNRKRLRNAVARRKLQELHEEKVLQSWLAEVWDQAGWSDKFDRNSRFHRPGER